MSDKRYAKLVLKTSLLIQGTENEYGFTPIRRPFFTWKNINLKNLLGTMYDDYDYFTLSLSNFSTCALDNISSVPDTKNIYVRMSGLPWVNSSYDSKTNVNNQYSIVGGINFISNDNTFVLATNYISTFGKYQETVNITIDLITIIDNQLTNAGANGIPQCIFMFDIIGVPKTSYLINN